MFSTRKTRMIVLPYVEKKYDAMLNGFDTISKCDRQTERTAISILHVSTAIFYFFSYVSHEP